MNRTAQAGSGIGNRLEALFYVLKAWAGICLGLMTAAAAEAVDWRGESLPAYDRLFQRTNGWIGADGNFAVSLTNDLTLWLFSDTFIGAVRDGHRVNATMINNSAAWQRGANPVTATVEFFHGQSSEGKPTALITPTDGHGWFWLFDATLVRRKLYLFLPQFERTRENSAFGFRQIGAWLGEVSNPFDPPTQWRVMQHKIPFARFTKDEKVSFGSALMTTDGFVYIYGIRDQRSGKSMILARAPEAELADFPSWRFRARDGWSTNASAAADLCAGVASEYSVSWLPALKSYVLIYTANGLSERILARTAPNPWGPWSAPDAVYHCSEMGWSKRIFCYSAKAHPMLATQPDELIVTYAANSYDFAQTVNDTRLYWPRFVRVKVASTNPAEP